MKRNRSLFLKRRGGRELGFKLTSPSLKNTKVRFFYLTELFTDNHNWMAANIFSFSSLKLWKLLPFFWNLLHGGWAMFNTIHSDLKKCRVLSQKKRRQYWNHCCSTSVYSATWAKARPKVHEVDEKENGFCACAHSLLIKLKLQRLICLHMWLYKWRTQSFGRIYCSLHKWSTSCSSELLRRCRPLGKQLAAVSSVDWLKQKKKVRVITQVSGSCLNWFGIK